MNITELKEIQILDLQAMCKSYLKVKLIEGMWIFFFIM